MLWCETECAGANSHVQPLRPRSASRKLSVGGRLDKMKMARGKGSTVLVNWLASG